MQERKKRPPARKANEILRQLPARTDEEEEKQAGGYAMDLALKWLREGTAPAQIVTHFLKVNSPKEQAEVQKLRKEIEVLEAKKKALESAEAQDSRYQEVIKAMSAYAGKDQDWEIIEDEAPEYDD